MTDRLRAELESFSNIWEGGYFEGDPLDPMSKSSYEQLGFMSTLHATYLVCIKPYVSTATIALEIGPGRGAWTKALLPSRDVWAVDALSSEHNGFFEYLNNPKHVRYIQVTDFSLQDLLDDHFTYMFSYGALCHVSFEGITEYARATFAKMTSGSHCFWMVADYAKFNRAVRALEELSPFSRCLPRLPKYLPAKPLMRTLIKVVKPPRMIPPDTDSEPRPHRWYDAGTDRTCSMLESVGYKVLDRDVGVSHRDPVIHFMKV